MVCEIDCDYRLLVADDDPGFRETVRDILLPHFETITVGSGEEAIEVVEQSSIHLVLMDVHMHALSGVDAVRIVKSIQWELPCILITSDLTDGLLDRARSEGAYAVLRKPPRRGHLLKTITSALRASYGGSGEAPIDSAGE